MKELKPAEASFRASYWIPKVGTATAVGVPPIVNKGMTVLYKCIPVKEITDVLLAVGGEKALTGAAVVAGGPANSYKAGNGAVVLTRPTAHT